MKSDLRRHQRRPARDKVLLSWTDNQGTHRLVKGRCINLSRSGFQIETTDSVDLRTYVSFRADRPPLSGSGSVRYCQRKGLRFLVGVEFSGFLLDQAIVEEWEPLLGA